MIGGIGAELPAGIIEARAREGARLEEVALQGDVQRREVQVLHVGLIISPACIWYAAGMPSLSAASGLGVMSSL